MSANNNINVNNENKTLHHSNHNQHSSGMTPSIISTINNTSPVPINNVNNPNSGNINPKTRRPAEPFYESYIEDSFVGHWETEEDDPDNGCAGVNGNQDLNEAEDEAALNPSTIEFDFDSFGPESFIYTPAQPKQPATETSPDTASEKPVVKATSSEVTENPLKEDETGESSQWQEHNQLGEPTDVTNPPQQPRALNPTPIDCLVDAAQIDLKVIEPYKKVISHAGYCHHFDPSAPPPKPGEPAPAIIVFSACYLPDRSRRDYNYVMDHLFLYVLTSLHELIADDYILIYLHNAQPSNLTGITFSKASSSSNSPNGPPSSSSSENPQIQNNLPTFTWMKRCYQMIDRRLRKNLKILYLVKPTFWLKTIVIMCKPFISSKFSKKLRFVESMDGLGKCLPLDQLILPASAENL